MRGTVDGKARAREAWGASPTGWTAAGGAEPGTREFFERARKNCSEHEQPWLPRVVPFGAMAGKRVLEIGCDPGYDACALLVAGAIYSGIDITPENVERTKQHLAPYGLRPHVQEGNAEALPFPGGSFDVVYSTGVLHHVPSIETALAEIARVLKPGGDAYVIVYNRRSLFAQIAMRGLPQSDRLGAMEANTAGARPIVNAYSRREVRSLLNRAGLTPVSLKVCKLTWEDMPPARLAPLDAIGRAVGWYIVAHATSTRAVREIDRPRPAGT